MTRETKVGIVVAASFASLIGGVFAVKYMQSRTDTTSRAPESAAAVDTCPLGVNDHMAVASAFQYCWVQRFITLDRQTGQLAIHAPGSGLPPRDPTELVINDGLPKPTAKQNDLPALAIPNNDQTTSSGRNNQGTPGLTIPTPEPAPAPAPSTILPVSVPDGSKSGADASKEKDKDKKPESAPNAIEFGPVNTGGNPQPKDNNPGGSAAAPLPKPVDPVPVPAPPPAPVKQQNSTSSNGGLTLPTPVSMPTNGAGSESKPETIPMPTPITSRNSTGNTLPMQTIVTLPTPMPEPKDKTVTLPTPPPMPEAKDKTVTLPTPPPMPEAKDKTVTIPIPPPMTPEPAAPMPSHNTPAPLPPEPPPRPSTNGAPAAVTPMPAAPVPGVSLGQPTASLDPSGVRPNLEPKADQRLDSYEEEWYRCQAGDTLEKISQKFFYTTKYTQALRQYNLDRQYSRNLTQEAPLLDDRQIIRIPPARVLETKYPSALPGFKSTSGSRLQPAGGAASSMSPSYAGSPSADQSDMSAATEYKVPRPNMTLRDIAKDQLGNSEQWRRIFLLNRWLNPTEPVPEGAMIYLPRDTNPR